jgi:2-oxoglutarate ferredoxin oxidoreductase subunit delta
MARAKGLVTFDVNRCKGCELCTSVCPVDIVMMDTTKINAGGYHPATVTDMDKCIGCANCASICPDLVIRVERIA